MLDPWDSGDDSGTVFRDVILLALAGFVFITVLLLPHINPKAKDGEGATDPPGNVIAEMKWDDKLRTDVETAVRAGRVDYEGAGRLLRFYEDGLHGYTYLEG